MAQRSDCLPPEKRAAYYRQLAADVLRLAQMSSFEEIRNEYLDLASRWSALADEIERAPELRRVVYDIGEVPGESADHAESGREKSGGIP